MACGVYLRERIGPTYGAGALPHPYRTAVLALIDPVKLHANEEKHRDADENCKYD